MTTTLTNANRQWATRPQDERFTSLHDLHTACVRRSREGHDGRIDLTGSTLRVNGDIILTGPGNGQARLTHWSAGQLCTRLGVPRDLLTKLSPDIASAVLNDRLPKSIAEGDVQGKHRVLMHNPTGNAGDHILRAFHGDVYDRVWDSQVTGTLMEYLPKGWRNPVAYEAGKYGAALKPSGLYAGDRDMFAFFIDGGDWAPGQPNAGSFDVDGEQFNRGFFVWNSEVGAKTFGWMSFIFDVVCGNHYVWGARDVAVTSRAHRGTAANRALHGFRRYLDILNTQDAGTPEGFAEAVRAAKREIACRVVASKANTLEDAFKVFKGKFTQTVIVNALDAMLREEKNVTGTRYDWLAGFTAAARELPNADDRFKIEKDASDLLLVSR